MNDFPIETHPFAPVLPPRARVMMMGTFPPAAAKRCMAFHYPNFQNDMWRIFGLVFFADKDYFVAAGGKAFKEGLIRDFLHEKGIAISDTAHQVVRLQGNASDKFLQIVTPLDLAALLAPMPHCDVVMTTGELATDTLLSLMPPPTAKPAIGAYSEAEFAGRRLRLYRLPSSSRAYPLPLAQKAAAYARFFREIGLLEAF